MIPRNRPRTFALLLVLAGLPLLCVAVTAVVWWGSPSGSSIRICAVWLPGTRGRVGVAGGWYEVPVRDNCPPNALCAPGAWHLRLGLTQADVAQEVCSIVARPSWLPEEGEFLIP